MKSHLPRTILAFYSAEEGNPEGVYRAIRETNRGRTYLFRPDATPQGRGPFGRYPALRLDGESLVVAEAAESSVEAVVKQLQSLGSPAVFVLREDLQGVPEFGAGQPPLGTGEGTLGDFARAAARRQPSSKPQPSIFVRLRENELALAAVRRDLEEAARLGHSLTAAAEWLLDNAYLVRTQIAEIRLHLPRYYSKILPALASGYELAHELVMRTDHSLNEANISEWLREYQTEAPLTIAELWFFPLLLRMALIDALRQLAQRVSRAQQLREAAYLWANRLASSARLAPAEFERILGRMEREPIALEPYFVTSLVENLQDEENALAPIQRWLEERVKTPIIELVRTEHTREAAERISTANAFGSLRALSRIDFSKIFEAVSVVEAELRADPVYSSSDFTTRDQCRRVVEQIARCSNVSELEVARQAVKLAERASGPKNRHAAYYLLADGVYELEADTKARVPARTRLLRFLRRNATVEYLTGIVGLGACFLSLALALAWDGGVHQPAMLAVLGALALFPLGELSIQIVNALVISLLPPEPLPKMDFRDGIPAEDTALVVIPMMLSSLKVVHQELEKLEVRYLANREEHLFFGLLCDFMDGAEPSAPSDAELLKAASEGTAALNARYEGRRFVLFHRPRVWSESEKLWIGRERKRGKIEDLNQFLCDGHSDEIAIEGSLPLPVRYVVTLDTDTQLPPGTARRMVETIAHPLNQVEIDPETGVRKSGFTIVQPRVSIGLPGATATRFTRIFADTSGTDPYCQTVSDAQQDLFGEAIFHGKAIYDVHAFRATLENRFPAETLLSHDLIEGAHAGVGLASDIELFENLPVDYVSFCKRQHRWIRGDWQIAPWIFSRVPAAGGGDRKNALSLMNRWRIFDNLRRSLVPIASLLLLLFGWLISAAPGLWSLVVGLVVAIPAFAPLLDRLARRIQGSVQGWRGAADELVRAVVMIAFLPHQALLAADAIARVVYRTKISRRQLLEWQPADNTAIRADPRRSLAFQQMLAISAVSVVLMMVLSVEGAFVRTSAFLALWCAAPVILIWLSRPVTQTFRDQIDGADALFLRRLSRRTWRYFDDLVNADSNWLPPDNSQLALRVEVAQRTSPTNIGLWLTSALAAADFGYITPDGFLTRCAQTMETLDRLERYEGHLLNWYDTRSLQPLAPRYVSTVDSGNLLASLWVLERGCRDQIHVPLIGPACLKGLSDTLSVLRVVSGHRSLHRGARSGAPAAMARKRRWSPAHQPASFGSRSHAPIAGSQPLARDRRRAPLLDFTSGRRAEFVDRNRGSVSAVDGDPDATARLLSSRAWSGRSRTQTSRATGDAVSFQARG